MQLLLKRAFYFSSSSCHNDLVFFIGWNYFLDKPHVLFELSVLEAIQEAIAHPSADALLLAVSRLGDFGFIWIAVSLGFAVFVRTRRAGISMLVSLLFGYLVCNLTMKPLFERLRPCDLVDGMSLIACPPDFSFPSGHTTSAFAAATALAIFYPRLGIPALLFAALMAFSRLYLFVHFPSDIAAGAIIGSLCAWAACLLVKRLYPQKKPS